MKAAGHELIPAAVHRISFFISNFLVIKKGRCLAALLLVIVLGRPPRWHAAFAIGWDGCQVGVF